MSEYGHMINNAKLFFIKAVAKSKVMFIALYSCQPCFLGWEGWWWWFLFFRDECLLCGPQ